MGVVRVADPDGEDEVFFFFFTLVTCPRRSLRLKLRDTRVCEPQIRARLGTVSCEGWAFWNRSSTGTRLKWPMAGVRAFTELLRNI